MIKLDFSNVTGGSYEPFPAGDYVMEIENIEEQVSKAGNQMLNITFSVAEGEYKGRKVFEYYVLTENALWRLKDLMVALGVDVDGMVNLDIDSMIGEMIVANIEIRKQEGYDPQNQIKTHKPLKEDNIIL